MEHQFTVGQDVWIFYRHAWRQAEVLAVGKVNTNRVKARFVNTRTGREIVNWFGGAGQPPVYPGSLSDPLAYTCTDSRCPLRDTPWYGHPGTTVEQLRDSHEHAWHRSRLRLVRTEEPGT